MNFKNKAVTVVFVLLFSSLIIMPHSLEAEDFPKWPVRNGDFSTYQGWSRPADWNSAIESGEHVFTMEPAPGFFNKPAAAAIATNKAGRGYYFQDVSLMKGEYRLSVELSGTPGSKAMVQLGGASSSDSIAVGDQWQEVIVDASITSGPQRVCLYADSTAGEALPPNVSVKFRNVKIEVRNLASSPVLTDDSNVIGSVVLPENPSLSEQYALYELQHYIHDMNGKVPGLKGRDATHEGLVVYIGRAISEPHKAKLKVSKADSYVVGIEGREIYLGGNTGAGTLYAVYDFLKQQGCRWVIPGKAGEIVPKRESLVCGKLRMEEPDYIVRGCMQMGQSFLPDGGWIFINLDDYFDWAVRNRMNAMWFADGETRDLGAHRDHGWIQMTNHSYNSVIAPHQKYFKSHPEWYALADGKRISVEPNGIPSQLCVSNTELREYTVELALAYFKENPLIKVFPLNPMDGYGHWCECSKCKSLDRPGLDWSANGVAEIRDFVMTDRALNYANYVAERVSKVYPDKLIEMHAYCLTTRPPKKEKVHPNVMIKYANLTQTQIAVQGRRPLNVSLLDPNDPKSTEWREDLEGWSKAGAKDIAYYNYADWVHPDVPLFRFFNVADELKNMNRLYDVSALLGETETAIQIAPIWYNVMAGALWDGEIDLKEVMHDICIKFYGAAGKEMEAYNLLMDEAIMGSNPVECSNTGPNSHMEFSLEVLEEGQQLLMQALEKAKADNAQVEQNVAQALFGHACLTLVRASGENEKSNAVREIAQGAFDTANSLRKKYNITVTQPTLPQLTTFYFPIVLNEMSTVLVLPAQWRFKTDPSNIGIGESWFKATTADTSWKRILTTKDWTSQGHDYHGVAWYFTSFTLPSDPGEELMLYFGAIDGYADIYLDGIKIGEQKGDIGTMWDKDFLIPLPSDIDASSAHYLIVRVEKDRAAAGIWKPAKIVKAKK